MKKWMLVLLFLLSASACQVLCTIPSCSSLTLDISNYDHSCSNASDCIAVPLQSGGCCGTCDYGAINRAESNRYESEIQRVLCCTGGSHAECTACPIPWGAECNKSGVCEVIWEEPQPSETPPN